MNTETKKPDLAVGPMSSEVIEAVFRYSHFHRTPLFLISSKNQIYNTITPNAIREKLIIEPVESEPVGPVESVDEKHVKVETDPAAAPRQV